jgi:hypothetical protein
LSNNYYVTNEILGRYTVFLLSGYTLQITTKDLPDAKVVVSTIKMYLRVVNAHYKKNGYRAPFDPDTDSDAAKLLREQKKFETAPARRSPLDPKVLQKMCELAQEDDLGFRAATWEFTGIGTYGGFRLQEFAMDKPFEVRTYVLPDGTQVVRAFQVKNFIFYDDSAVKIKEPLRRRRDAKELGTEFDVQKNRMNGQITNHRRLPTYPAYCPVNLALKIVTRAEILGYDEPDDPLCVYKDTEGIVRFLTGTDVTEYFRFVTKLVIPSIEDAQLKLISTHSLRVTACVFLHEAGKDGTYIKLRLRWLSNCFEIYLRNTNTITAQHMVALDGVHKQMADMALATLTDTNDAANTLAVEGIINLEMDDLEDED